MKLDALVERLTQRLYDAEYKPGIQGILESNPRTLAWIIPIIINLLIIAIIAWLWLAEVDVISPAQGSIILNSGLQRIQPRETSVVEELLVSEGDHVSKGQLLVRLRNQDRQADVNRLQNEIGSTRAHLYRLAEFERFLEGQSESDSPTEVPDIPKIFLEREMALLEQQRISYEYERSTLKNQVKRAEATQAALKAEVKRLEQLLPFAEKRAKRAKALAMKKMLSETERDSAIEEFVAKREELQVKKFELERAASELDVSHSELSGYERKRRSALLEERLKANEDLSVASAEYLKAREALDGRELRSPLDGIVHNVAVKTTGGVVQSGETLMQVIPKNSPLELKVNVLNRDVGFVENGQSVKVKLDAFPFTKYGHIEGKVKRIDRASVQDEKLGEVYPSIIELAQSYIRIDGREVALIPGMTGTVDVRIGSRTLMEYLLAPVYRYKDEALRER
jgi:HlyD family type I secretion membrane fusion protein